MKIMDRYILREFLIPFAYIIAGFSMMSIIIDLFNHLSEFIEAKASMWLIVRYYSCVFLQTLEYILPASLLFATIYTQSRMAKNSELTAMRACGVSFARMMTPYLAVAFTLSATAAILKETVTPSTTQWAETLSDNKFRPPKQQMINNISYYNSLNNRIWTIGSIDMADRWMADIKVKLERRDNSCYEEITAKSGKYMDGQWWFFDGRRQPCNADGIADKGKAPVIINPAGEAIPLLTENFYDVISERRKWEYFTTLEMLDYMEKHPNISREGLTSKKTDLHARLAIPWAGLLVTLFGIPVGARGSKQNAVVSIILAVALFLGFYFLTQFGIFCAKKHILWPWLGAWLSNIVASIAGMVMITKMR